MTWWIWFLSSRQWKQILDGFDSYLLDSKSKSLKRWVWEFRKDLPVVIDTSCINGKTDADPCIDLEDPMRLWVVSWVSDGKAWLDNSVGTWIKNGKARIWYIYTTIRQQMISWTRRVVKECQAQPPSLFFRVGGGGKSVIAGVLREGGKWEYPLAGLVFPCSKVQMANE